MNRKPLIIGDLKFEYPFVLAPLAGITDRSMRSLCYQAGASLTYTEMVSAKGLWYGDRKTADLLRIGSAGCEAEHLHGKGFPEGPVGFQLFGSEPEILKYAVRILADPERAAAVDGEYAGAMCGQAASRGCRPEEEHGKNGRHDLRPPMGARTAAGLRAPALFDLNAGCPVPKIVRNGEGSALLRDPDLLYECVEAMVAGARDAAALTDAAAGGSREHAVRAGGGRYREGSVPRPVTVKIRIGFEREDNCAVEIARAAQEAGAAAITVHGRTRQQFYEGKADWETIAAVKAAVKIPVIGNGDVMSGEDAIRMLEETGCDGVMIARGALGNPWIFARARALWDQKTGAPAQIPDMEDRITMLLRHLDMVCEDKGEAVAVREMRKHIGWYIKGMPGATRIRRQVNAITTAAEIKQILRDAGGI